MAKVFDITIGMLEVSAAKIDSKCAEFTKAYRSIYVATAELRVKYKGQASDTFNNRIEGYRNDFQAVEKALKNYAHFLREYAAKMKAAENEITNKASQLGGKFVPALIKMDIPAHMNITVAYGFIGCVGN